MKCLYIVTEHMSAEQTNNSYLMCLAMLNFDHQVEVVFTAGAFAQIQQDEQLCKQWLALKLYGVSHMYQLIDYPQAETNQHLEAINYAQFATLSTQCDHLS